MRGTVWGAIEKVRRCGRLRKRSKLCGSCTNSRVASGMPELPRGNRPQVYPRRDGFTVSTGPATASIGPRAGQCGNRPNPAKRLPFRYRQIRSEHIDDAVPGEADRGDWPRGAGLREGPVWASSARGGFTGHSILPFYNSRLRMSEGRSAIVLCRTGNFIAEVDIPDLSVESAQAILYRGRLHANSGRGTAHVPALLDGRIALRSTTIGRRTSK
jgi:hypothetical protein